MFRIISACILYFFVSLPFAQGLAANADKFSPDDCFDTIRNSIIQNDTTNLGAALDSLFTFMIDNKEEYGKLIKKSKIDLNDTFSLPYNGLNKLIELDYSKTSGLIDKFEQVTPDNNDVLIMLCSMRIKLFEGDKAIKAAEKILERNPNATLAQYYLCMLYNAMHRFEDADMMTERFLANSNAPENLKEEVKKISEQFVAKRKRMTPYYFFHQWLSVVAPTIPIGEAHLLSTPDYLNTIMPKVYDITSPFSNDSIKTSTIKRDGRTFYVWKFPEPTGLRDALYMAFSEYNGKFKAFAVCIGQYVDWELSTSNEQTRSVFGRVPRPESADEFVDLLVEKKAYDNDVIPSPGEFMQEGYVAPPYSK